MGAFFCWHGTCYIYVSLSRRPGGLLAAVRRPATRYPRKREALDSDPVGIRDKEECDGTHATRTKTRVFQRRAAQRGNHWLRVRRLAARRPLRGSGAQTD